MLLNFVFATRQQKYNKSNHTSALFSGDRLYAISLSKQPDLRLRAAVVWELFFPRRQVCCLHLSAMWFSNYTSALFTGDRLRLGCLSNQTCASVMQLSGDYFFQRDKCVVCIFPRCVFQTIPAPCLLVIVCD